MTTAAASVLILVPRWFLAAGFATAGEARRRCFAGALPLFAVLLLAGLWSFPATAAEVDELALFPDSSARAAAGEMLRNSLRQQAHNALDQRLTRLELLKTPEQIAAYQDELREFFLAQLGGFPERTPLNARIVGELEADGFRVEKVIYESQPGFHVTASMYLPLTKPPYPGVLLPCGHSPDGKAAAAYQKAAVLLARNGLAVLCFDPIGQGERCQLLNEKGDAAYNPTSEHLVDGVAPVLLGENLARHMIWDGIRGIDYLQSRDDILADRIGCTGNSGGGNMTSYLMALEERILCAAPGCFITISRLKNDRPGPGDAEQNIHGQLAGGLDHPDYLILHAPRPVLICSATHDFVPIEGAWNAFRQAKRIYTRLGYPERVDLVEADERHGFSRPLREGVARWMTRWLLNEDRAITETAFAPFTNEQLRCTPEGQVVRLPEARTLFDINRETQNRLEQQRKQAWRDDRAVPALLQEVRRLAGIRPLADLPVPEAAPHGAVERSGCRIEKLVLNVSPGHALPALLFRPEKPSGPPCLYVDGSGKLAAAKRRGPIEQLVQQGRTVLAVDVRGCGELENRPWRFGSSVVGPNAAEFYVAYMLGRSVLGLRAEDILIAARHLAQTAQSGESSPAIELIAVGEAGPPALHAAALEPQLFSGVTLRNSLKSWKSVIEIPLTRNQLINTVHGALRVYDLADLARVVGERIPLQQEDPTDATGNPLSAANDSRTP